MSQKPRLPTGTRDFGPEVMARRGHIISVIRKEFELSGFMPLETPAMELLSVLTGKYGPEGDRLIYRILNSGNYLNGVTSVDLEAGAVALAPRLAERALRYDLTVPLARYVATNHQALALPFRRYQIQPVWRADRPQRGRYREFWQCDADVIGSHSPVVDTELLAMTYRIYDALGLGDVTLRINHRGLLEGMARQVGWPGTLPAFCQALDKLDKIGPEGVLAELGSQAPGFAPGGLEADRMTGIFAMTGRPMAEVVAGLETLLVGDEAGQASLTSLSGMAASMTALGVPEDRVVLDPSLARGLDYYTGMILEVAPPAGVQMGSLGGGGRYDELTEVFGVKGMPGVGVSFGLDRIYDVMLEQGLFLGVPLCPTRLLVVALDAESLPVALTLGHRVRASGVATEVYPEAVKLKKPLSYAEGLSIPYVALIGSDERGAGTVTLKDMGTRSQRTLPMDELVATSHALLITLPS